MSRIRAALRLASDNHVRQQQLAYLADREITVLRQAGLMLWVSCTDSQLHRLTEQGIGVHQATESETLELPALAFDPAAGDPEPSPALVAAATHPYWLVLFAAPPAPEWLDDITALGGELVHDVPQQGAVFRIAPDARPALADLDFVLWSGPYHPAYAIDFTLTTRGAPFSTATLRELQLSPDALPPREGGNLLIGIFDDVDPADFQGRVAATGATVQFADRWSLVATADTAQALAIALLPGVACLEGYGVPIPGLDHSRVIVAADQVAQGTGQFLINLDGAGEIAGVMDTGLDTGVLATLHVDIRGRVINARGLLQVDVSGHGTHVSGIIAGNGAGAAAQGLPATTSGVAPASFVIPQPMTADVAIVPKLMIAYRAGARAHNDSWRQSIGPTGNEYTATASAQLDRICFAHPDMLVVFCSHNDEEDILPAGGDGMPDMRALRPEQVAKNILCVGASENVRSNMGHPTGYRTSAFTNAAARWNHASFTASDALPFAMSDQANEVALFSNRGNVTRRRSDGTLGATGRICPHIVAPGTNVVSMTSTTAAGASNRYMIFNGTSQAAPHVTGAGLLVRQYYRSLFRLLRRPRLLEEVPSAAAPPATDFFGLPAVCPHADGLLLAWFTPVVPGSAVRLMANRVANSLVSVNANPIQIGTDIGDTSSLRVARHGEATLVLHRQKATGIQLRRLKRDLSVEAAFGTAGTVAVTTAASTTAGRPAALLVTGNQAAVAWVEDASGVLRFRLFNATTGATVSPVRDLGAASQLSPHGAMAHDGTRFALAWGDSATAGHFRLRLQRLDAAGAPIGGSIVLVDQATVLREPHLAWDPGRRRYLLAWCDEIGGAGAVIRLRFLDADGVPTGGLLTPVAVPAGRTCRRPFVAAHPVQGGVLAWEDDTHDPATAGLFDVYATILDAAGAPLTGIPVDPSDPSLRHVLRISDTPLATSGFAANTAADGSTVVVWQSADEINSDRRGAYAIVITSDGTLQAQADPNTPMIRSGAYVSHVLATYAAGPALEGVSACWAGGQRFVLRMASQPTGVRGAELVRTSADGVPAPATVLPATADVDRHSMLWTGQRLIVATAPQLIGRATVHVLDAQGAPVAGLASHQLRNDASGGDAPELGFAPGANARILVGYQCGLIVAERIRLATLNAATLVDVGAIEHDLVPPVATGHTVTTAPHGWFQYVHEENRVLAAFSDRDSAGVPQARIARTRRNATSGVLTAQPAVQLTTIAGESTNAVIAPRPVGITGTTARQRQHMVAFQFRAAAVDPWEIRVSRLDRDGTVFTNPAALAPLRRDIQVIFPAAPGWFPATDATVPQLVCTYLDEPLADPGPVATAAQVMNLWSPGFGLAFLGQPAAGGVRTLYFTLLDEHGRRVQIPPPPGAAAAPAPAPIHAISSATAHVRDFTLAWTGRYFWLTWIELEEETLRHCQTAITRTGRRMAYDAPSAALVRATVLNGATNLAPAASPPNLAGGFGWGRLDLRQSLAPTPPVTFHARDDAVGPGSVLTYEFELPAGTQLLRVTLAWDDPPGPRIRHPVTLHVTPPTGPAGQEYRGNQWSPANLGVSGLVPAAAALPPVLDNVQQVVVRTPRAGRWRVQVRGGVFNTVPEFQFPAQAIALVFAGSGREVPFTGFVNRHPAVI